MTTTLKRRDERFEVWFWNGISQNGYFIRDTETGFETGLYCDSEGAEFIEHLLQLGPSDFASLAEDEVMATAVPQERKETQ